MLARRLQPSRSAAPESSLTLAINDYQSLARNICSIKHRPFAAGGFLGRCDAIAAIE
jgi:hypothetical protein